MFFTTLNRIRGVLSITLSLIFIANLGLNLPFLHWITQYLIIAVVFLSLFNVRGVSRIIGFTIYLVGIILLWYNQAPLTVWLDGINRNTYMLVMFALTPCLSIPLAQGGYSEALQYFLTRYLSRKSLFSGFISTLTFGIATILNVAAVNLVYQIGSQQTYKLDYRMLTTSITRGYSASMMWAPTFVAVALPLELTGVKWLDFFPYALGMGLIHLITIWILTRIQEYQENRKNTILELSEIKPEAELPETGVLPAKHSKKLLELIFFWFLILGLIIFISWRFHMNTINIVSIVAILIPPLWLLVIGRINLYLPNLRGYYLKEALPRMSPEIVLFSGAGFMASAIDYTGAASWIPKFIDMITIRDSSLSFIAVALGLIIVLSIFGVHAMITVVIIGGAINPALYGISPLVMCLILAIGWGSSLHVSNSATVNIMLAGIIQKDPVTVSLLWNYRYSVLVFILGILFLQLLTLLGL